MLIERLKSKGSGVVKVFGAADDAVFMGVVSTASGLYIECPERDSCMQAIQDLKNMGRALDLALFFHGARDHRTDDLVHSFKEPHGIELSSMDTSEKHILGTLAPFMDVTDAGVMNV